MPGANGKDSSCRLLTRTIYPEYYYKANPNEYEDSIVSCDNPRVARQRKPPLLHCFGHVHSQFGVAKNGPTLLSNASQERLLRDDLYGGGAPLIIDLPLKPSSANEQSEQTSKTE